MAGALVGTMEVWLEPMLDGTVLHYFLRADPPAGGRDSEHETVRRRLRAKEVAFALKRALEGDRPPGEPPSIL